MNSKVCSCSCYVALTFWALIYLVTATETENPGQDDLTDDFPAQTSIPDEEDSDAITDLDVLAEVTLASKPS